MTPRVFAEFDRICRERGAGGDVLEIGAIARPDTLLCLPALARARSRIGVNMAGEASQDGWRIMRANANRLDGFADASFDTVLSNSVFEHDRHFWLSLREMRRVARPGALIVVGVPGYAAEAPGLLKRLARVPGIGAVVRRCAASHLASTATLVVHEFPADYYRFSPQAVREVLLDGLVDRDVRRVLSPPRLVGAGVVPTSP